MNNRFFQCCYTNNGGWGSFAVSPGIPRAAYDTCNRFQNVNSSIPSEGYKDESGNDLNLFEIHSDGEYVYVCRTQFGLVDKVGRNNMFSHAYVIPWRESGALANPDLFLGLTRDNFADNVEDAEQFRDLVYAEPRLDLNTALAAGGMSKESYLTLIRCIYANLAFERNPEPIFIQYDGSDAQLRAILYCIYSALPYYLRRRLKAANAVTKAPDRFSLIFSRSAATQKKFFLPETGETNALREKALRRIERLGFVDYPLEQFITGNKDERGFNEFFDRLESLAVQFGDPGASSEDILKIAFQCMRNTDPLSLNREELLDRLTDALFSKSIGSDRMDDYIAGLLSAVTERSIELPAELEGLLETRMSSNSTKALTDSALRYYAAQMQHINTSEAAEKLAKMPEPVFRKYADILLQTESGKKILEVFFTGKLEKADNGKQLNEILARLKEFGLEARFGDIVARKAADLFALALDEATATPDEAIRYYAGVMGNYLSDAALEERLNALKQTYWKRVRFTDYSAGRRIEHDGMICDSARCAMFQKFSRLLDFKLLSNGDIHDFFDRMDSFFDEYGVRLEKTERNDALEVISDAITSNNPALTVREPRIKEWCFLAAQIGVSSISGRIIRDLHEDICALREHIPNSFPADCGHFITDCVGFYKSYKQTQQKSGELTEACKRLYSLLVDECIDCDTPECPIPLDTWLSLSRFCYGPEACFDIFDRVKPPILTMDPAAAVIDCELLSTDKGIVYAQNYIDKDGSEAKTVKKWITVKSRQERNSRQGSGLSGASRTPPQSVDHSQASPGRSELQDALRRDLKAANGSVKAKENEPAAAGSNEKQEDVPEKKKFRLFGWRK